LENKKGDKNEESINLYLATDWDTNRFDNIVGLDHADVWCLK
jgi:hypothetical protein